MSLIKDVSEAHHSLKALLIWLLVAPFWYVAFYLFKDNFLNSNSTLTVVVFVICFTLLGNVLTELIVATKNKVDVISGGVETLEPEERSELDFITPTIQAISFNIIWLSFLIFVLYTIKYFSGWTIDFYYILLIKFVPLLVLYLAWEAKYKRRKKRYNRQSI